jgi:hypothetical protein
VGAVRAVVPGPAATQLGVVHTTIFPIGRILRREPILPSAADTTGRHPCVQRPG